MQKRILSATCIIFVAGPLYASAADPEAALDGYWAVRLVKMNNLFKAPPKLSSVYDGRRYLFPSPEQKRMFDSKPTAFVPAMGGNWAVCKVEMGKDVPGKAEFQLTHKGRLYLFPSAKQRDMFRANPNKYADADIALGGNCSVCKIEIGKDVPGKPEVALDYKGRRYLFPSQKQRDMFLGNAAKYAVDD